MNYRVPAEAWSQDSDGINIDVLLHVVNGRVKELEIYKADLSQIRQLPDPGKFEVFQPR